MSDISHLSPDRRQVLQTALGLTATGLLGGFSTRPTWTAEPREIMNRFPRMLQEYYVRQLRLASRTKREELDNLANQANATAYVQSVRERIRQSFGSFPQKTPLHAKTSRRLQRDGYTIEHITFNSRPNFPVTANLYLPEQADSPLPAVVGTCGHSSNGKAAEPYQFFAQGLARLGIACLIYDPIGQGERLQFLDENLKSPVGVGVREHLQVGNQQFLIDEFLGTWRAWDGIRALDYLISRDDIDSKRIGVTGNSGGGTMTTWLCGLDQRWAMAAPSCFVSTIRHNLENELPQDTEQCPPDAIKLGIDHSDFLAAMAPKPIIILAKEQDYFDVRGAEEAYRRLRKLYRLFDAEDNVALFVGPTGHGYSQENREAMFSWFTGHSGISVESAAQHQMNGELHFTGELNAVAEPELVLESDSELQCSETGQVGTNATTWSVADFTRAASQKLAAERKPLTGEELVDAARETLAIPAIPSRVPHHRNWRYLTNRGFPTNHAMAYTIETAPAIQSVVYMLTDQRWHSRPPRGSSQATLYVPHLSSDRDLRENEWTRELYVPEQPFFTCDPRGIGESLPGTSEPNSLHSPYGSDYFYSIHAIMLGESTIGQRTYDLLRVIDWVLAIGYESIHLVGRGWGTFPATFATLLHRGVKQLTLKHYLESYAAVAEDPRYRWPLSCLIPGILKRFDLPDCHREIDRRISLTLLDPMTSSPDSHED